MITFFNVSGTSCRVAPTPTPNGGLTTEMRARSGVPTLGDRDTQDRVVACPGIGRLWTDLGRSRLVACCRITGSDDCTGDGLSASAATPAILMTRRQPRRLAIRERRPHLTIRLADGYADQANRLLNVLEPPQENTSDRASANAKAKNFNDDARHHPRSQRRRRDSLCVNVLGRGAWTRRVTRR
jgi:hypothetical protein